MKYTKRLGIIISALILLMGVMVVSGSAQTRRSVRRVYYYRPFISHHYWGYDPYWSSWGYDPYFYDPYLREQRDRYYKEKSVRDARKKLEKDRTKYQADGVITAKEAERLMKRRQDYEKAVAKLAKFNQERS
jgi:hypothetical protein